ncbi:ABC transporter ATP-binding protein [Gloeobacter morelensis]|uniref:ABC transporter ATP-binding protein n=1 Tax=Gloeobacter morelensis MG652769 TaxID=2781736 RepID=A0ABY3PLN5_9CYAN|nr:ABC transporter ATP-binding protein [Gloeobacter morelensis]UFP94606.1 ABC transporter ATP-binding protein [Gloeobacter morelensis MG652769]
MSTWGFFGYILRYRPGLFVLNALVWGAFHLLPLAAGLVIQAFFDTLAQGRSAATSVWTPVALLVVLAALRMGAFWGGWYIWATLSYTVAALLRGNVLAWLVQGPGSRVLPGSSGEAISRLRDDVQEVIDYLESWVDLWGEVLFAVLALAVMLSINPVITGAVLLPLVGFLVLVNMLGERLRRYRAERLAATGKVTEFVGEIFTAVQAVKLAGAEERVVGRFGAINDQRHQASLRDNLFSQLLDSLGETVLNVGIGCILLLAASSLRTGSFSVGDFALFVSYLIRLTDKMYSFGHTIAAHKKVGVSFARLSEMLAGTDARALVSPNPVYLGAVLPTVVPADPCGAFASLEVRDLTYRYPDSDRGIAGIAFAVPRGSFTVITGRIGAGKTTLLRVLLGLLPREGGEIYWNGAQVSDPASFLIPPRCAYTPQVPRLFSETLQDNLLQGFAAEEQSRLARSIHTAVLEQDVEKLERRLETVVGPRGVKLSGGQVQRSAAARMFVRDAQVLVFDDLSSALDVETEGRLWQRLFAKSDLTCLVVSHRRAALRRADQIVLIDEGRLIAQGDLATLLAGCPQMRELWESDG